MSSSELFKNWQTIKESVAGTIAAMDKIQKERLYFGIALLDEIFGGFIRNDTILIGAGSGVGKTQLAILLATSLAKQGVRVGMLALEAMKYEITMRIAFSLGDGIFGNYRNFVFEMDPIERAAKINKIFLEMSGSDLIRVFYKTEAFGIDELRKELYAMEKFADVIILDHFHFLDLLGQKSETQEQKEIAAEIDRIQKTIEKTVIIIGQYSKSGTKSQFAQLTDFYGTSALTNMVTKAITISQQMPENLNSIGDSLLRKRTLFSFPKCRLDGTPTRYFAVTGYDLTKNKYDDKYLLYNTGSLSPVVDKPTWAKNAVDLRPY